MHKAAQHKMNPIPVCDIPKNGEIELKWERWKLKTKFMEKNKNLIYIVLAFVAGLLLMYLFNNYKIEKKNTSEKYRNFLSKI